MTADDLLFLVLMATLATWVLLTDPRIERDRRRRQAAQRRRIDALYGRRR